MQNAGVVPNIYNSAAMSMRIKTWGCQASVSFIVAYIYVCVPENRNRSVAVSIEGSIVRRRCLS